MKPIIVLVLLLVGSPLAAQELFIQTEPASNMPAGRFGLRVSSDHWQEDGGIVSRLGSELMYGVTKDLMVHAQVFGSNQLNSFDLETYGLYAKYRLYSDDGFKYHFRISAFAEALAGKQSGTMPDFSFKGSGPVINGGIVLTLLESRLALSTTIGGSHLLGDISLPMMAYSDINGMNASLSAGYLVFPDHYTNYSDPNINLYAELLAYHSWYSEDMMGQHVARRNTEAILSIGPQLILNSVLRFDLAYSMVVQSDYPMRRPNSFFARVEYNFY